MAAHRDCSYKAVMAAEEVYHHRTLPSGIEFAALEIPGRRTAGYEIRIFAGMAHEPDDRGGLARVVEDAITKGTQTKTAQEVTDAFDALGAQAGAAVGRESMLFRCSCLPEYLDTALALHAEILRAPTFPDEYCRVAVDLARQELTALEDDPGDLSRKIMGPSAFGERLGRHELGSRESLDRIDRAAIVEYWRKYFSAARMQVAVGGAVDVDRFAERVDQLFTGFGDRENGRTTFAAEFRPGFTHHPKELEQEHLLMCWPGAAVSDRDYPVERLALAILSGGMSSRLFAEVREKQGLVYWVGAWDEHPRGSGRVFMGASTTPPRSDLTLATLLREVDRLSEDLTQDELDRARVGIVAKTQTHGDITRARVGELGGDLFHYGRPVPPAEKNAALQAVTIADVKRYLAEHPRDPLCVLALGPRPLEVVRTK
ncbi:MAG TPA: pitrilysin family protein [Phycisphaerae bacterium]|nr:pitrilysin family protein [Phycisphaerae bacterium]